MPDEMSFIHEAERTSIHEPERTSASRSGPPLFWQHVTGNGCPAQQLILAARQFSAIGVGGSRFADPCCVLGGCYCRPSLPEKLRDAGAVAFKRAGDPNVGEFSDAVVLKKFGDVPEDSSEL
jgi:hypothetical protein